jgi:hypothetical protein
MNERIKELAEQARNLIEHDYEYLPDESDRAELIQKKLAELIVKECINQVDQVGYKASNNISAEDTELFKSVLKKHFGIK